ncbi:UNVERIFIED_ORG: LysM repeat protein [Arthrobacter sp. UYEF1]
MILSNLANVLRDAGLTVVETAGWQNRGFLGRDLIAMRGVAWHHTATNRARFNGNDAPTLQMCIDGRPDVAGPLCNIVFGRNGTVYLVAAGLANHAGAGSAAGIPTDMGNYYLLGIEMESSGIAPWDWTEDQIRVAPYLGAAIERAYLRSLPEEQRLQIAHYEYSSQGKIDPAGWPGGMDGLRASINSLLYGDAAAADPMPVAVPVPVPVTPNTPAPSGRIPYCTVDPGDTLAGIAQQFSVPLDTILAYNPGLNPDVIHPGQVIYLLDHCFVDPGDTLAGIADQFKIPLDRIIALNPGIDPNVIHPGQAIFLQ